MSLYDLRRVQIAFCGALGVMAMVAATLGAYDLWPVNSAAAITLVALASLAVLFPRGRAPERPL